MASAENKTLILPAAEAEYVDALVSSGAYSSASEVVSEALHALEARDSAMDRRLREEVAPVYDAYQADPGRGLAAEEVFASLRAHHAARTQKSA